MAVSDALNSIFQGIDQIANNLVQSLYSNIASAITPVLTIGVTVYVAYYGYELMLGRATVSASEFVWRLVRICVIYSMLQWGTFQVLVSDVMSQTADSLSATICQAVAQATPGGNSNSCPTGSGNDSGSGMASTLGTIWNAGATAAANVSSAAGILGIALAILGYLIDIVTLILIAECVFIVMLGKLGLFLMLGLGPIFIVMALFSFSSSLFTGWLRACVSFALVPLLAYGVIAFVVGLLTGQLSQITGMTTSNAGAVTWAQLGPFFLLCFLGVMMMSQVPQMAAGLAGGTPIHHTATALAGLNLAGRAMIGTTRGTIWGATTVYRGGRGVAGYVRSKLSGGSAGNGMRAGENSMQANQVSAALKNNRS